MADDIFDRISTKVREALEEQSKHLPPLPQADMNLVKKALNRLDKAAQHINDAGRPDDWTSAVKGWRDQLEDVARTAFGRTPAETAEARDELFVRFLQTHFPRMAAALTLLGIITASTDNTTDPPRTEYVVDWVELEQFIRDPETLVNEQFWEDLLADVGHPHSGRILAVLAGLIIMAPRTIIALAQGQLKVGELPPPPVRGDPTSDWARFRSASEDWISATLPIGDPTRPNPNPANKFEYTADMEPDLSATLALRSNRYLDGGDTATDFELWLALGVDQDLWEYDLGEYWFLRVSPGITAGFGRDGTTREWHGAFAPLDVDSPLLPPSPDDPVTISIDRDVPGGLPDIQLGPPYDTRLIVRELGAWIKLRQAEPVFEIAARIKGLTAVLAPRWFRTFGQTDEMFREGIRFDLDFDIGYGLGTGVQLNLSSGLEVLWVINQELGDESLNVKLHSIRFIGELRATAAQIQARVNIRFHVSGQIGPVGLVIDGPGAWFGNWPVFNENTGQDEIEHWGLLPPTGAGVSLNLNPLISVGGFIDWRGGPSERYAGLLHAKIYRYEVVAFGIHEKTPEGRTSFILVVGIRFLPGIPIGYGFNITGFGGVIAMNRRIDADALRERLTSGATGNVLFAPDPVKSAPIILGDLDFLFPAADNVHAGGPTVQITWLDIARFDVGILFEIAVGTNIYATTGLTKIVLLGTVRLELKSDLGSKLIAMRMDMVGLVDFTKDVIEFDATHINSRLLEYFIVTGDTAFRMSWGDRPYAMLAMGGFHPAFVPEPAQFPEMARLGLYYDFPERSDLWLRLESYLAFTTNTLQLGAAVEVGIKAGKINAVGWLVFDALIQFRPFWFSFSFSAGFRVRWKSTTFTGVKCIGTISGPGPITLTGSFCIEVLFFDICWSDTFTLGNPEPIIVTTVASLLQALEPELSDPANLEVIDDDDGLVTANSALIEGDRPVVSPMGRLSWTQKRAPLNCLIERIDGAKLPGPQAVEVIQIGSASADEEPVKDWFSPGSFTDLSDSEKLNRASFERLDAGLTLGPELESSAPLLRNISVHIFYLPRREPLIADMTTHFPNLMLESIAGRTADASAFQRNAAQIRVRDEGWSVHAAGGGAIQQGISQTDAHQQARYAGATALPDDDIIDLGGI